MSASELGRRKFIILCCEVRPIHWPVALLNPSTIHSSITPTYATFRRIYVDQSEYSEIFSDLVPVIWGAVRPE